MKRKPKKFLFAIDGVTGVGKTTVSKQVKENLGARTERIEAFTKIKRIRDKPNIKKLMKPFKTPLILNILVPLGGAFGIKYQKTKQRIAIFDRSPLSMVAYTKMGKILTEQEIRKKARQWADYYDKSKINKIFVLDIEPKTAEKRLKKREGELILSKSIHNGKTVEESARRYRIAADEFKRLGYDIEIIKVNPNTTKEEVTKIIEKSIEEKMKKND